MPGIWCFSMYLTSTVHISCLNLALNGCAFGSIFPFLGRSRPYGCRFSAMMRPTVARLRWMSISFSLARMRNAPISGCQLNRVACIPRRAEHASIGLIVQAAHGQVDGGSRHPARLIRRHKGGHVRQLLERHEPSRVGLAGERLLPLF